VSWKLALPASISKSPGSSSGPSDLVVDRLTCGNHQHDGAGRGDGGNQIGQALSRYHAIRQLARLGLKTARDRGRAVPDRDGKALFGDVQRQCRAHGAKADQADLRLCHRGPAPFRLYRPAHHTCDIRPVLATNRCYR